MQHETHADIDLANGLVERETVPVDIEMVVEWFIGLVRRHVDKSLEKSLESNLHWSSPREWRVEWWLLLVVSWPCELIVGDVCNIRVEKGKVCMMRYALTNGGGQM